MSDPQQTTDLAAPAAAPPVPHDFTPPQRIGRYRIEGVLGQTRCPGAFSRPGAGDGLWCRPLPWSQRHQHPASTSGSVLLLAQEADARHRNTFETAYAGQAPWDMGKPQKPFLDVADRITGSVLDAGCGTGENVLFFASRGHKVTGIDFLEEPITRARRKATERRLSATSWSWTP
jgi:hypothetical protein